VTQAIAVECPSTASDQPVFVVGCHRSGTTLLRRLLNAHPRLCCPPESKFISAFEAFLRYPQALRGLQGLGVSVDRLAVEFGQITSRLLRDYARARGKARWIDKTPNYYRQLELIDGMFERHTLYVLVLRHPLDTVQSLSEVAEFAERNPEDPDIAAARRQFGTGRRAWAHYWCAVYEQIARHAAAAPERFYWLKYEDLVTEPAATMASLLNWLGETCPETLVEDAFGQPLERGYGDWKIRRTTNVHTAGLRRWGAWHADDVDAVWQLVKDTACEFGYGID
jgi:protein-tyrosine sulfotransferase